jgi:hypothetical protein
LADFIIAIWKKEAGHKINKPDFVAGSIHVGHRRLVLVSSGRASVVTSPRRNHTATSGVSSCPSRAGP